MTIIPEEIEKYKKYLKQAQIDALVKKQRDYNNEHADERVEAEQSVRTQNDQTRRLLQNRGLASAPGNIISGEEPRRMARTKAQFDEYNEKLRRAESGLLENAAISEANKTIAEQNAAAQAAARAAAERAAAERAAAVAAEQARKAKMQQEVQRVQYNHNAEKAERYANQLMEEQWEHDQRAGQAKQVMQQAAQKIKQSIENSNKAETERQMLQTWNPLKTPFYKEKGYEQYEDNVKTDQIKLDAAEAELKQLKATRAGLERGHVVVDGRTNERTVNLPDDLKAIYDEAGVKIVKLEGQIDTLKSDLEKNRSEMAKINQEWNVQEAFQLYGGLSEEDLNERIEEEEKKEQEAKKARQQSARQRTAAPAGTFGMTFAASGSKSYTSKSLAKMKIVKAYRDQRKREDTIEEAMKAASGTSVFVSKKYESPGIDNAKGWDKHVIATNFLKSVQTGKYSIESEKETGSKYYKAVNDKEIIDLFAHEASKMGSSLNKLTKHFVQNKDEEITVHFHDYALQMTPEEVNAFNYLYQRRGPEAADIFFEALLPVLDQRGAERISEDAREFANQYPVLSDLATVPLNILSGIYGPQHNIQNAIYGHETGKLEAYGLDAGNLVREHRQEDWTGEGQFAYGTAMSILDSTAAAFMSKAIPGLGGAALGGSAYNSELREALDRGLSYNKAQKTAIAAGVLEMLFEELSIEKLFKVGEAGSIGELAGNILKQAGFEASEEMNTEIGNMVADIVINGDEAKLINQYNELRAQGYSEKDAFGRVALDATGEVLLAGAGGLVSGGLMGGAFGSIGYARGNSAKYAKIGSEIRSDQTRMNELMNYRFKDENAAKLQKETKLTDAELGRLSETMRIERGAESETVEVGKKLRETEGAVEALQRFKYDDADLQELSRKEKLNDKEISALYFGMQEQKLETIRQTLGVEGKKQLNTFEKITFGVDISRREAANLSNNRAGIKVFNKTYGTNSVTRDQVLTAANKEAARIRNTFGQPVSGAALSIAQDIRHGMETPRRNTQATPEPVKETVTSRMTDEQRRMAALPSETDKTGSFETERGKVSYAFKTENARFLTSQQKAGIAFAQAIANVTGANIHIVDTLEENGYYDRKTNTLTVALDSDRGVMHTVSHELTHWLENTDPEAYEAFVKVLEEEVNKADLDALETLDDDLQEWIEQKRKEGETLFETFVRYEKQKDPGLSDTEARSEAVAECCEPFLSNKTVQTRIANENLSKAKKIAKFLKDIYKAIQTLLDRKDPSSREARLMRIGLMDVDRVASAWADAVNKASKRQNRTQKEGRKGEVQYQHRDQIKEAIKTEPATRNESKSIDMLDPRNLSRFYREAEAALNDNIAQSWQKVMIGEPSELLKHYMKSVNTLYIGRRAIRKAVYERGVDKGKHGLGKGIIYELPYELNKPVAITGTTSKHAAEGKDYIIAWTRFKTVNGDPIIAPISINIKGEDGVINNVDTVFGVDNREYLYDIIREGNILYIENGKNIEDLLSPGLQLPKSHSSDVFIDNLSDENESVKHQKQKRDFPAPILDDRDQIKTVAKPKTDAESIDAALSARSFKPAFERIVARKKAETKEWSKRTELADGRSFREKDVKALAKTLLKTAVEGEQASVYENVKANMKTDALAERLTVLLPKTWNALHGEADGTETMNEIRSVLKEILKSVQGKDTSHEEELALLKENLPKTIYLSEGQYAEVVSAYGNVYSFAKKLKAALGDQSVIVRKAGGENRANLDENWSEIVGTVASEYVDISDADQPIALLELAETMKTETISIYQNAELIENMADILVEKMLDQVVEIVPEKQNVTTEEAQREVMSELAERAAYFKKQAETLTEELAKTEKEYAEARRDNRADISHYESEKADLLTKIADNERKIRKLEKRITEMKARQDARVEKRMAGMRAVMDNQLARAKKASEKAIAAARAEEKKIARKQLKTETQELLKESGRQLTAQRKQLIRESMEKEEKAFKAGRKEGKQDQRELYAKKKLSESLKKNLKKIGETANHPKISMFIPEELMKSVSTYMKQMQKYILDPEKSMDNEIALKLQRAYERMKYDSDGMILNEIDDQIKETIPKLEEIMNKKAFKDLTAEEMKIISNTMSAVTHALTTSNKLINRAKKVSIQEQGERMIDQMHEAKALPKAIGWYLTRSLSAERFARLVSNYREDSVLVEEMQHLNEGAIEKERIAMEANKLFEDFIREYGKEYQTWFGKKAKWIKLEGIEALNTTEPEPVYVTNAMKLSMIMHARNPQNMKHILKGQITVPDQKLYRAGKLEDAYTKGKRIIFSASDVINLEKNLTEAEKAYLRCAEKLFYEFCPNAINKTSLALYGFRKAEVQNYFPIRTDKNYVKTNFEGIVHNGSIENMGMLKERKDASNPIILEDITQAVRRQIENTALFAGMAIPIRNFNRVMNVSGQMYESSVKSALEEKIGSKGMQVIEKILSDLQQKPRISDMDQIVGKITSNIVRATLATNLSVTIKQAASYPTAAAVLSWKSLAKALAKGGKNGRVFSRADMDLIEHYTPLLYIRKQGMIDRDIADYTTNKTWADKLPFIMDWIRKVDVATVGRLWYASEYEVADLHPELVKGSDAYYMEVAKLFNEVVQKTQPNYTTLQRAHFLRSENAMIHAIFGMFKTQAMQNGGILIDAAGEFFATRSLDKNDPHRRAAAKQLGKAISSQLIQNIVFCSMTLLAKAAMQKMNPYRDDDDELTKESIAVRFAMDMLQSFAGSFFAGSELFDVIMTGVNKMTGKEITAVYDSSTLLTDTINDVEGAFGALGNLVRHTDSKGNLFTLREYWKQTDKIIKAASQLAGVPYGNIKNIVMGIVNHTEDLNTAIESGTVDWFRHSSPEMEKQKTANAYKEWTKSGNSGKTFFYYKRKVDETKGTDEKRVVLNDAEDLTADQKAALDRMLIYAGEAETRIKDGALQKLTADNEWEIVADYSSSGMLQMSLISDSAYQTTVNLISAGLQENDAITAVTTYRGMPTEDESGKTRNQRFREWLNDQPISSKQKIAIDNAMIGSKRMPDYSDKDLVRLFTSASESTYENTVKLKATAGLSTKDAISIVETYKKMPTEDPSGTSRNQRFREWLSEQKFTKEQKETIDREIIKGKTVPDYSDKAWVALYNAVDISVYEKAVTGYQETGLLPSTFSKFYEQYRAIDAKDENGETVSGLKKKRTVELLKSIGLTDEQYKWLYYSFLGYKK